MSDYPSEDDLERIAAWDGDWRACFAFIRSVWWMPEWGWHEATMMDDDRPVTRYEISTGGWSGNEEIIGAMHNNPMLWTFFWMQSRRGGHYIFELPEAMASVSKGGGPWSEESEEVLLETVDGTHHWRWDPPGYPPQFYACYEGTAFNIETANASGGCPWCAQPTSPDTSVDREETE